MYDSVNSIWRVKTEIKKGYLQKCMNRITFYVIIIKKLNSNEILVNKLKPVKNSIL